MKNQTFVVLMSGGKPASLSTGVRLISGNVVLGCEVHTRSYDLGGFDHYLDMTGFGPDVEGWADSVYHPPVDIYQKTVLDKSLQQFEGNRSVEFKDLLSDNVFWYPDKEDGTHVLMDERTRRMVRVSAVEEELQKGFWTGIAESYSNTLENFNKAEKTRIARAGEVSAAAKVEVAKGWGNPRAIALAMADLAATGYAPALSSWKFAPAKTQKYWEPDVEAFGRLYRKGVYMAFNPAPFEAGKRVDWFFDGPVAVRFKIPPPPDSDEFITIENEKYMGLAPMPV
jgi:hypothetical protein